MRPAAPYYGNIVRKLFITNGLVILITLPFVKTLTKGPVFYSLLIVIVLAFFAGITSSKHKKTIFVDVLVSAIGFGVFAYQGVISFQGFISLFFVTNFVLAILFLFAFYWSVKSAREIRFSHIENDRILENRRAIINPREDSPPSPHKELSEEDRRRKRFLGAED